MIQRVQSIYLLLAGFLSGGLTFFVDLWSTVKDNVYAIELLFAASLTEKIIPVLFFLSALLSIITIFLFENRQLQFVIGRLNILTNLILLGLLLYVSLNLPGELLISEKGIGMFLPIVTVLLLVLANKAIKKDEDLVKSVDRLR